ncbi:aspartic peptidase domain-containing protein [Schizophyllum amplum]|uniref:Aspartic peptidase domain-containing protein n=1 Tax=Schizophyllum amplum TaxID=97359 RepID=A0A550CG56_9AGAR|nr:aspartic peptidase domain-containing protein [Auriculariopsis ampla]
MIGTNLALAALSWLALEASAFHVRMEGQIRPRSASSLAARGNLEGTSPLTNSADISYYTNVTLGGEQFKVLIDTGSSDLWVAGSVKNAKDTGHTSGVTYAVGAVKGPIKTAELEFSGFTVPDQAYIEVTPSRSQPASVGLIGLGPNSGSNVYQEMGDDSGMAVLDSIFTQNTSTPNYITVLLGRLDDPTDTFPGDLTVGTVLDNYTDVQSQPKLNVTEVPVRDEGDQHFQILIDEGGIIGPDGKSINVSSEVDETQNKKQATAVLDTGFSLSQVPMNVAAAIYGRFPGAEYANVTGVGATWIVPCSAEVNLTIKLSGKEYPVHPMDTTLDPATLGLTGVKNSDGDDCCIGTYQPVSFDIGDSPTYDMILGMSFIRNVYALFNYGDFLVDSKGKADPYIQLLSTTDPSEAHSDFVKVRLNGDASAGDNTLSANPASTTTTHAQKGIRLATVGIVFCVIAIVFGVLAVVLFLVRRRRRNMAKGRYAPLEPQGGFKPPPGAYQEAFPTEPVQAYDPAPHGGQPPAYGQQPAYGQEAHGQEAHAMQPYSTPWGR